MSEPTNEDGETQKCTVTIKAQSNKGVCVDIKGIKRNVWLPRSKVTFPESLRRGEVLEIKIPHWVLRNEGYGS